MSLPVVRLKPAKRMTERGVVVRLDERALHLDAAPLRRAHATLTIKQVNEGEGLVTGIASTVSADHVGDRMEPNGAIFKLPLPFLMGHNAARPLGHVVAAMVTDKGIQVTAKIARGVAPFIDEAWTLIAAGLVRGLSVGFRILESTPIKGTGGLHITRWAWLELSAVVMPANADAQIESVRACDRQFAAADYATTPMSPEIRSILRARAELPRLVRNAVAL